MVWSAAWAPGCGVVCGHLAPAGGFLAAHRQESFGAGVGCVAYGI